MGFPRQPHWLRLLDSRVFPSFRHLLPLTFSSLPVADDGDAQLPLSPTDEPPGFMVKYLVSACGLSMAEATKASRYLAHAKSPAKPEAVLRLMRAEGLDDAHIRRLVVSRPTVLMADPKRTLQPKIRSLLEAGFSVPELAQLLASTGAAMPLQDVLGRVQFWRNLLGTKQNLLKALNRNSKLLSIRQERALQTLSFLRTLGFPDKTICSLAIRGHRLVISRLDRIEDLVERVRDLGIAAGSPMFVLALCTISNISRSTLDAKIEFLKGFGWSQDDVILAFQRYPCVLNTSHKKIQAVSDFLLEEAECSASYAAHHPLLFGFSIERRLVPRFRVIKLLRMEGLPGGDSSLYNAMLLSDHKFVDKYILPNSIRVPTIFETFLPR